MSNRGGLTGEIEANIGNTRCRQGIRDEDSSLRSQQLYQRVHRRRVNMHAIGNHFSVDSIGLRGSCKRTRSTMQQGPHGIETMRYMRDTQLYCLLRLLISDIGMAHAYSDASI